MKREADRVEMLPIDSIRVPNPRVRNPKAHAKITESIKVLGLKRPITVRREPGVTGASPTYAAICGQGRLESCRMLGQTHIAAIVVEADEETAHIMSIVENVARRLPRSTETLEQISVLKQRGYTDVAIGQKIGCSSGWVNGVVNLLEKGEKKLLGAVEAGDVPLSLAIQIARSTDEEAQSLLLEAYERGDLKGRKIVVARRLLEQRARSGKGGSSTFGRAEKKRQMTPDELNKMFQRDTAKHRLIHKRAEHTEKSLLIVTEIFKELFADREFCELLKRENLSSVPQPLAHLARSGGYVP